MKRYLILIMIFFILILNNTNAKTIWFYYSTAKFDNPLPKSETLFDFIPFLWKELNKTNYKNKLFATQDLDYIYKNAQENDPIIWINGMVMKFNGGIAVLSLEIDRFMKSNYGGQLLIMKYANESIQVFQENNVMNYVINMRDVIIDFLDEAKD